MLLHPAGEKWQESRVATASAGIDAENPSVGQISRMIMFADGSVFAGCSDTGNCILLEPRGATFTHIVSSTRAHFQYVSKYAPRATHHLLRGAVLFRNTHTAEPFFCPDVFRLIGIPFPDPAKRRPSPVAVQRAHWPRKVSKEYCYFDDEDAVHVNSMDGHAHFSLSPHRQLVRLSYPLALPVLHDTGPAWSAYKREQNKANSTPRFFHVEINQLYPVHACPPAFAPALQLAFQILEKVAADDDDDEEEGDTQTIVDTLLPAVAMASVNEHDMLEWRDVGKEPCNIHGGTWKEEAMNLCKSTLPLAVPTALPTRVDWTPDRTIWVQPVKKDNEISPLSAFDERPVKSSTASTFGTAVFVAVHDNDAFLHVTSTKSEDGTGSAYVYEYRMDSKGTKRTFTIPGAPEYYKHTLRYIDRLQRDTESCEILRFEPFRRANETPMPGADERAEAVYKPLEHIEREIKDREMARDRAARRRQEYENFVPDMHFVMEQTRRFLHLQQEAGSLA